MHFRALFSLFLISTGVVFSEPAFVQNTVRTRDGKTILAGYASTPRSRQMPANADIVISRQMVSGEADTSFGKNGSVHIPLEDLKEKGIPVDVQDIASTKEGYTYVLLRLEHEDEKGERFLHIPALVILDNDGKIQKINGTEIQEIHQPNLGSNQYSAQPQMSGGTEDEYMRKSEATVMGHKSGWKGKPHVPLSTAAIEDASSQLYSDYRNRIDGRQFRFLLSPSGDNSTQLTLVSHATTSHLSFGPTYREDYGKVDTEIGASKFTLEAHPSGGFYFGEAYFQGLGSHEKVPLRFHTTLKSYKSDETGADSPYRRLIDVTGGKEGDVILLMGNPNETRAAGLEGVSLAHISPNFSVDDVQVATLPFGKIHGSDSKPGVDYRTEMSFQISYNPKSKVFTAKTVGHAQEKDSIYHIGGFELLNLLRETKGEAPLKYEFNTNNTDKIIHEQALRIREETPWHSRTIQFKIEEGEIKLIGNTKHELLPTDTVREGFLASENRNTSMLPGLTNLVKPGFRGTEKYDLGPVNLPRSGEMPALEGYTPPTTPSTLSADIARFRLLPYEGIAEIAPTIGLMIREPDLSEYTPLPDDSEITKENKLSHPYWHPLHPLQCEKQFEILGG